MINPYYYYMKIRVLFFSALYRFFCMGISGAKNIVAEGVIAIPQRSGRIIILGKTRFCREIELSVPAGGELTINGGFIGPRVNISCMKKIHIGGSVLLASGVAIYDNNHGIDKLDENITQQSFTCREVWIGHDVWIGTRAIILPGVKIGNHAVIGAGSVITKDVPDWGIAVGNPARVIRMRNEAVTNTVNNPQEG